jgi:hypothetical protein
MRLLRELSRRKLRTTLTISGITIGIWALVVVSSMATRSTALSAWAPSSTHHQDAGRRR